MIISFYTTKKHDAFMVFVVMYSSSLHAAIGWVVRQVVWLFRGCPDKDEGRKEVEGMGEGDGRGKREYESGEPLWEDKGRHQRRGRGNNQFG